MIAEAQSFDISHEGSSFEVSVSSPSPVEGVELVPEKKQLIIQYPSQELQHFDNFQVHVDMSSEMMSGPFTATFNGMELQVSEKQKDGKTGLMLNGTHLDVMQMDSKQGHQMGDMEEQQNAIVITATTVVPEFPLSLAIAGTAIAAAVVTARKVKGRMAF